MSLERQAFEVAGAGHDGAEAEGEGLAAGRQRDRNLATALEARRGVGQAATVELRARLVELPHLLAEREWSAMTRASARATAWRTQL